VLASFGAFALVLVPVVAVSLQRGKRGHVEHVAQPAVVALRTAQVAAALAGVGARIRCRCWGRRRAGRRQPAVSPRARCHQGAPARARPGPSPSAQRFWPTRRTAPATTAPSCADGASRPPSPSRRTRPGIGCAAARPAAGRRRSAAKPTSSRVYADVDGVTRLDVQGRRGATGDLDPGVVAGDGELQPYLETEAGDAFDGGRAAARPGVVDHFDVVRQRLIWPTPGKAPRSRTRGADEFLDRLLEPTDGGLERVCGARASATTGVAECFPRGGHTGRWLLRFIGEWPNVARLRGRAGAACVALSVRLAIMLRSASARPRCE